MTEFDYYSLFRPPRGSGFASGGSAEWMGLIDPMTFVLRFNPTVNAILQGERPESAFDWGVREQTAAGILVHEMSHWWQLVGTTVGLLHASCVNVQSNILTSLLQDWIRGYEPRKSAFLAFRDAMVRGATPEINLLYNVVGRWMDLEFWSALMDQRSAPYKIADKPFFESSGKTLLRAAFYSLHQLLSLGNEAMHRAEWFNHWLNEADRLSEGANDDFTGPGSLAGLPIGGREILEGQARLTEAQYLYFLSAGRLDLQKLDGLGYFTKEYGHAMREFSRLTAIPAPTHSLDPAIGLCLLACDLALNPPVPYPVEFTDIGKIVRHCHPGVRFVEICRTIAKSPSQWLKRLDYTAEVHSEFTAALEPSPYRMATAEVASRCVEFWERHPDLRPITNGDVDEALRLPSTPLKLLLRKHVAVMRDKCRVPHRFCWYGALFSEVMTQEFGFMRHGPPLLSAGETGQIFGSPALDEGNARDPETILYNLLISQAMNDVVRQWVSKPGPFSYRYDWIDPREPESFWRTALGDYFKRSYGIAIDDVKILPVPVL